MRFDSLNRAVARTFGEGEAVTWLDSARTSTGIFDSRHYTAETGGEVAVSALETTLAVVDDPAHPVARGERVIVRGQTWRVKDLRPDGQGMTTLELER